MKRATPTCQELARALHLFLEHDIVSVYRCGKWCATSISSAFSVLSFAEIVPSAANSYSSHSRIIASAW